MSEPFLQRLRDPRSVEDLLLYRLGRLYATAGSMVVRLCEGEFGITRREWRFIGWLGGLGPTQPSVLAERAALDRARTSRTLSTLTEKGLVSRVPLPSDRRLVIVDLTDAGRELYQRILPRVAALNRELLASLDDASVATLAQALDILQTRAAGLVATTPLPKAARRTGGSARAERKKSPAPLAGAGP